MLPHGCGKLLTGEVLGDEFGDDALLIGIVEESVIGALPRLVQHCRVEFFHVLRAFYAGRVIQTVIRGSQLQCLRNELVRIRLSLLIIPCAAALLEEDALHGIRREIFFADEFRHDAPLGKGDAVRILPHIILIRCP